MADEESRTDLPLATVPEPVPYEGEPAAWLGRAACAGMDVDLFFGRQISAEAREACLRCPVRAECLGMALAFPQDWAAGYWAGTSQQERRRLRREQRQSVSRDSSATVGDRFGASRPREAKRAGESA